MTSPYYVRIAPAAERQIMALPPKTRKSLIKLLEALAVNPRLPGTKKIDGMTGLYSESMEHIRLIYKIEEHDVLVLLVK